MPVPTLGTVVVMFTVLGRPKAVFTCVAAVVKEALLTPPVPDRLATLAEPHLALAGRVTGELSDRARAWLMALMPPVAATVDRLSDLPVRLHTIFACDAEAAFARDDVRGELSVPAAAAVVRAWCEALSASPRLTSRDAFRGLAKEVGASAGAKGKTLFHSIRLAVTGLPDGPELDVLVPAIEQAADFTAADGLAPVAGCRERAAAFVAAMEMQG